MRDYADSLGIVCNQSHAPFPSSVGNEEQDKEIFDKIVRAMEVASILGAKIIVVHPKQHLIHAEHPDELFEMNVEFYKSLIPYCEKFGIKVACENMWQWYNGNKVPSDSTCSRAWEFNKYASNFLVFGVVCMSKKLEKYNLSFEEKANLLTGYGNMQTRGIEEKGRLRKTKALLSLCFFIKG